MARGLKPTKPSAASTPLRALLHMLKCGYAYLCNSRGCIALAKVRYYMVTTKLITNKFVVKMVILGFLTKKKRRHPKWMPSLNQ